MAGETAAKVQGNSVDARPVYRRRKPDETVLYQVLQAHLETFNARVEGEGASTHWPGFVKRELASFLDCGVLARGFCRFRCEQCGKDEVVAFSCKGRGFCPSCGGRRMAEEAAHLVDHVLPEVPIRQWVLTVPHRIRYLIAFDRTLCAEVRRIFIRAVQSHLRLKARRRGIRKGQTGAVVFLQRFGGSVNLNPHFHALVLDGVFAASHNDDTPEFHPLTDLDDDEVHDLTWKIRDKVLRMLMKKGILSEEAVPEEDRLPFGSAALGGCYSASVQGRVGLGGRRGAYVTREGRMREARFMAFSGERCAEADGFTLHANVCVHGRNRKRLERLCRYMARPAIASKRLERLADGRIRYRLRHPFHDGTRAVIFDPLTFIEKLCALVPPPRANLVTYHGVLAPNAAWRRLVVPDPGSAGLVTARKRCRTPVSEDAPAAERKRRYTWAQLMRRVFKLDVLECPFCKGRRKLIALITDAPVIRAILDCLGLPSDPPGLAPTRWPP
jgi:hypothetical protein